MLKSSHYSLLQNIHKWISTVLYPFCLESECIHFIDQISYITQNNPKTYVLKTSDKEI